MSGRWTNLLGKQKNLKIFPMISSAAEIVNTIHHVEIADQSMDIAQDITVINGIQTG